MPESITFPCRPEFVAIARHAAKAMLAGVPAETVRAGELVVSEFVTNSILWSLSGVEGSPIRLVVHHELGSKTVRLEVLDDGPRPAGDRNGIDPDQHGRGLLIVDKLAKCGHEQSPGRQLWWAELTWN